jgi:transposase
MALSDDLRKRVVEAVVLGGASRNAVARRFGVSIASAVQGARSLRRHLQICRMHKLLRRLRL